MRPQERYLKTWKPALDSWAAGGKVVKFIGYDAGEMRRVKDFDDARFMVDYPLVRWGWKRAECSEAVKAAGFMPTKTACFYCPSSRKWEVLKLAKEHPDLLARAIAMEENASAVTTVPGLGRSYSWGALVKADADQMKLFDDIPKKPRAAAMTADRQTKPAPRCRGIREGGSRDV